MIDETQVVQWCKTLAPGQGSYCRFLENFTSAPPRMRERFMEELNQARVKTIVEFVLWLES